MKYQLDIGVCFGLVWWYFGFCLSDIYFVFGDDFFNSGICFENWNCLSLRSVPGAAPCGASRPLHSAPQQKFQFSKKLPKFKKYHQKKSISLKKIQNITKKTKKNPISANILPLMEIFPEDYLKKSVHLSNQTG